MNGSKKNKVNVKCAYAPPFVAQQLINSDYDLRYYNAS